MTLIRLIFTLFATNMFITLASPIQKIDCNQIHNGKFFQYKNVNQFNSTIIRIDSLQYEINAQTGDTSSWKIRWSDDCTFTCEYLSGLKFSSEPESAFYHQSIITFKIKDLTDDYYCYDSELNYNSMVKTYSDTLWRHKK